MALLRFTFELFLGGSWVDITTYVRHQRVTITRGTKDEAPKLTPAKASLKLDNRDDRFNPRNPTGPYFGLLVRNTPLRISCAGGVSNAARFYGEVFAFEPRWNEDRSDCYVDIDVNGALRRLIGNDTTPRSYYRSWWHSRTSNPIPSYFWPLQEGVDASSGLAEIGQGNAWFKNAPASAAWGQAKMNDWTPNGVAIDNLNELHLPCDMRGVSTNAWEVSMLLTWSANEVLNTGLIDCGVLQYSWAASTDAVQNRGELVLYTFGPNGFFDFQELPFYLPPLKDAGPVWLTIRASWNGTDTLTSYFSWQQVSSLSGSITVISGSAAPTNVMLYPREVAVACAVSLVDPLAAGYIGVSNVSVSKCNTGSTGMINSWQATLGGINEWTDDRFERLCTEYGINRVASATGAVQMGRQYIEKLETHFQEILSSSAHPAILESRSANELRLLGRGSYRGEIDISEIVPDLEPTEDDRNTANIVRLTNSHAGEAVLTKATGEMSVAQIGPFDRKIDTNNRYFAESAAVAGRMLALGTWPGQRFTEVTVSARSTPAAYDLYRAIEVGDFFGLTGMSINGYYDLMIFAVTSVKEVISHEDHRFTFTIRPGELDYRSWAVQTNRIDIADSTVAVASSGATVDVNVPTAKWSTTAAPFDVLISGERMTVTGVTNLTSTTQRLAVTRSVNGVVKTVPVGATVHAFPSFFILAV